MAQRIHDLADLTGQALACRDEGHRWRHVNDELVRAHTGRTVIAYTQVRECDCGTQRRRTVAVPSFQILSSHYSYPDGYLIEIGLVPGGSAELHAEVRRATLRKILADPSTVKVREPKPGASR